MNIKIFVDLVSFDNVHLIFCVNELSRTLRSRCFTIEGTI